MVVRLQACRTALRAIREHCASLETDIGAQQHATEQHEVQKTARSNDEADVASEVHVWLLSWCAMETGDLLDEDRALLANLKLTNESMLISEKGQLEEQHSAMQLLDSRYNEGRDRITSLLETLQAEQQILNAEDSSYQVCVH